jgi:dihydroflavonol-4-reductase
MDIFGSRSRKPGDYPYVGGKARPIFFKRQYARIVSKWIRGPASITSFSLTLYVAAPHTQRPAIVPTGVFVSPRVVPLGFRSTGDRTVGGQPSRSSRPVKGTGAMRALVTGGTGCVGSNLVAALVARGITARVLHRTQSSSLALHGLIYESAIGDILGTQADLIEAMAGCEWVFHVAAISDYWRYQNPQLLYRVNVEGTRNVLEAAQRAGVRRFVFTSSLAAMGAPAPGQLLNEASSFNLNPKAFPYAHSKHLAEIEVRRAVDAGLNAVIVNPTGVIGPRDVNRVGGSFIIEAAKGRMRFAPPGGLNFVAVEDVAAGHINAAERGKTGERYILGGENLAFQAAFSMMCEVVGRPSPAIVIPGWALPLVATLVTGARRVCGNCVPVDANQVRLSAVRIYADTSKAARDLGLPQTPIKAAVQRAYHWYRQNGYLESDADRISQRSRARA